MITRFILVCLCLVILPVQAMACSCTEDNFTDAASKKNINRAAFILSGEVLEINESKDIPLFSEVEISINRLFKGEHDQETITAFADTKTSCGKTYSELKKQAFFILYKFKGQYVLASGCGDYISDTDGVALVRGTYPFQ